ncbi:MAG: hypothetical protein WC700_07565 [Gemmatimonadaceae bacterium]|jgi:hypothetical protein
MQRTPEQIIFEYCKGRQIPKTAAQIARRLARHEGLELTAEEVGKILRAGPFMRVGGEPSEHSEQSEQWKALAPPAFLSELVSSESIAVAVKGYGTLFFNPDVNFAEIKLMLHSISRSATFERLCDGVVYYSAIADGAREGRIRQVITEASPYFTPRPWPA